MVLRALKVSLLGAMLAASAAGCARSGQAAGSPTKRLTTATPIARPAVSAQILRARRSGPGWLDYCPTTPGRRSPAAYDLIAPGGGTIPGWCRTTVAHRELGDYVSFAAHWDATKLHGKMGTVTFVYLVPRGSDPAATPVPLLVKQSGPLPP